MMPRIQAEETLASATAAGLGSGAMKRHEARRLAAELSRRAGSGTRPRKADPQTLAAMGVAVREVH